jgi:hypothetical protein
MKTNPKPLIVEEMTFDKITIVLDGSRPVNAEATLVALKSKPVKPPVKK